MNKSVRYILHTWNLRKLVHLATFDAPHEYDLVRSLFQSEIVDRRPTVYLRDAVQFTIDFLTQVPKWAAFFQRILSQLLLSYTTSEEKNYCCTTYVTVVHVNGFIPSRSIDAQLRNGLGISHSLPPVHFKAITWITPILYDATLYESQNKTQRWASIKVSDRLISNLAKCASGAKCEKS